MSRHAARVVVRPIVRLGLLGTAVALPAVIQAGCRSGHPAASHAAARAEATGAAPAAQTTARERRAAAPGTAAEAPADPAAQPPSREAVRRSADQSALAAPANAVAARADSLALARMGAMGVGPGGGGIAARAVPASAGDGARRRPAATPAASAASATRGGNGATAVTAPVRVAIAPAMPPPPPVPTSGATQPAAAVNQGAAPQVAAIDPNGRFATTYRPGAGHLAAFEAALASGTVPASARELVGDLGARYAPAMDAPPQGALAMRVDLERAALPPTGGALRVRIGLRSTATPAAARPPMSVHLVLDCSGSMWGPAMDNARAAARDLVERLAPGDTFSLTRFSTDAQVVVPAGLVGPRRAQILQTIQQLVADGGTNISAGLELGYQQAARGPQSPETVKLVMLLSDGRANYGVVQPQALAGMAAQAFQRAVQTSAFGLGTDYDGPLMAHIAEQGGGGYYYVRDTARIAPALATELDARVQPVAQAVELRVRLRNDVQLTQTYGSRRLDAAESAQVRAQEVAIDEHVARRDGIARDRHDDLEGGMRFFIPGFARDDRHVVLLGLRLPAGAGDRPVATVELRYKDRITGRNVVQELPVRARYADSDAASLATLDASVARTVQGFDAGETLVAAARAVEQGDRARAAALLTERQEILRASAARLAEPRFHEDAARLDRFRELAQGSTPLSDPLVLALLMDTSARGYMH